MLSGEYYIVDGTRRERRRPTNGMGTSVVVPPSNTEVGTPEVPYPGAHGGTRATLKIAGALYLC